MKKILIWLLCLPAAGYSQKFDGVFDFKITTKYDHQIEDFIPTDTSYYKSSIKKVGSSFIVDGVSYNIVEKETTIDTFYLEDDELLYDIEYTCTMEGHDKFIIINIVSSNDTMYFFTIARMINEDCIRNEYTNFELEF